MSNMGFYTLLKRKGGDEMQKTIAMILALILMFSNVIMPVCAVEIDPEDPMAVKDYAAFGAPLTETEPEATESETISETESAAENTVPKETSETVTEETTAVQETLPEETEPATEPTEPDPDAPKANIEENV